MILSLLQIFTMVSEESAGAKIAISEIQLCRKKIMTSQNSHLVE